VAFGGASSEPARTDKGGKPEEQPVGEALGVSVYAQQVVHGHDRAQLERLCRYVMRPPLSQERLERRVDGRLELTLKNVWKDGTRALLLLPHDLLVRLCAAVPPPRHPLIRFYGVFAPHSGWRVKVVPIRSPCCDQRDEDGICSPHSTAAATATTTATTAARIVKSSTLPILARLCSDPVPYCTAAIAPRYVAPVAVREPSMRIDWAELLKRVHDVDALACPCGGRLKFVALILDEDPARAILESLHLPSEPPPIARARSPDWFDPIIPVDA
jgi:hypothetical protein